MLVTFMYYPRQQQRKNTEQSHEVSGFSDFEQNSGGGSISVSISGNIEIGATFSRNNTTKIDELMDAFNDMISNADKKSVMTV